MTTASRTAALACAALIALPLPASSWTAWNRHEVFPVSDGVWEVVARIGSGAQQYWCGIGDYAVRVLKTGATQRIYIWAPIGQSVTEPQRKAVQFSLSPPPGADTSVGYSLSVKRAGDNMSVAMAQSYCYDRIADEEFWRGG